MHDRLFFAVVKLRQEAKAEESISAKGSGRVTEVILESLNAYLLIMRTTNGLFGVAGLIAVLAILTAPEYSCPSGAATTLACPLFESD